jgi:hypothetical protein
VQMVFDLLNPLKNKGISLFVYSLMCTQSCTQKTAQSLYFSAVFNNKKFVSSKFFLVTFLNVLVYNECAGIHIVLILLKLSSKIQH